MRKNLFKILVVTLAAAGMASFTAMGAFAANTVITDGNWTVTSTTAEQTKKTITVQNVTDSSESLKVTAYQIVKGTYKDGKLTGYVLCDKTNATLENMQEPTADEITAIANNITENKTTLQGIEMTKSESTYTAKVEAGLYIVIVTGSDTVVYNPAVVAVNVEKANDISTAIGGSVDMTTYFNFPVNAYVKSGSSGFKKQVVGSTHNNTNANSKENKGDTVAFGDTVKFKLDDMTIPSYSKDYAENTLKYEISDTLESGAFSGIDSLTVKVGRDEVLADSQTYTLVYKDKDGNKTTDSTKATSFTISFVDKFIRANGTKSVEITYSSTITNEAGLNYAENKNTASLKYSNNPSNASSFKEIDDTTYHYTFGIDAAIDSEDTDNSEKTTYELNKVTKAGETYTESGNTKKSPKSLAGATFTLYSDNAFETQIATAQSDVNGHISFTGLDEGVYYLKETAAPDGYTINDNDYQITIDANMNEKGVLTSYSIVTKTKDTDGNYTQQVGSATYSNRPEIQTDGSVKNNISENNIVPAEIVDTQLSNLPSTGGAGTIVLTIGAALGMGAFLTIYIVNKKKNDSAKK